MAADFDKMRGQAEFDSTPPPLPRPDWRM